MVTLNGAAWALTDEGERILKPGDPVYEGESVVTGKNANMEIRFADGTLLAQGGESRVDLDEFVYDDSSSLLDFHMVTGVLRLVSGKIAETNPEAFNISTPLTTVGIRGTEIVAKIDVNGQIVGVTDMSPGHYVVVATAQGEVRIDTPGLFSGVDRDGFLIQAQALPQDFIAAVQAAAPLTSLGEADRDPNDIPPDIPDPTAGEGGQGGPPGEPESQSEGELGEDGGETPGAPLGDDMPPPAEVASTSPPVTAPPPVTPEIGAVQPPPPPQTAPPPPPGENDDPVVDDPAPPAGEKWVDQAGNAAFHVGTSEADTLSGLDYDDTLKGGAGADSIEGGQGNDFLKGDAGADSIRGGSDADTFYFDSTLEGVDSIEDFGYGSDKIGVDSYEDGFNGLTFDSGSLNSTHFYSYVGDEYSGTGLSGGDSVALVYASDSGSSQGKLYFDPDINTPGDEVLLADIQETDSLGGEADSNLDATDIVDVAEPEVS